MHLFNNAQLNQPLFSANAVVVASVSISLVVILFVFGSPA
jgi:hypothetical protein